MIAATRHLAPSTGVPTGTETDRKAIRYVLAALRLALGWIFLWAFLDKLFGLGLATKAENARAHRRRRDARPRQDLEPPADRAAPALAQVDPITGRHGAAPGGPGAIARLRAGRAAGTTGASTADSS